jgi:hypothetical protein
MYFPVLTKGAFFSINMEESEDLAALVKTLQAQVETLKQAVACTQAIVFQGFRLCDECAAKTPERATCMYYANSLNWHETIKALAQEPIVYCGGCFYSGQSCFLMA